MGRAGDDIRYAAWFDSGFLWFSRGCMEAAVSFVVGCVTSFCVGACFAPTVRTWNVNIISRSGIYRNLAVTCSVFLRLGSANFGFFRR